jgi:phosphonate transport system substrate-binding protein
VFAAHPLHSPELLFAVYAPIADYLTARIPGIKFRLEMARNYDDFEKRLSAGAYQFALANPYQTVRALRHGYDVSGKLADDHNFRGIVLARKDSGIENISDLKGRKIGFPAPTAIGATMMVQHYLQTHGLDVNKDIEILHAGSHESAIMSVYLNFTAAAGTRPAPWQKFQEMHPGEAKDLAVRWETGTLPNSALLVHNGVPPAIKEKVCLLLFSLQDSPEGRALLNAIPVSRFEPATSGTYEPVRTFLRQFSTIVRPIEE